MTGREQYYFKEAGALDALAAWARRYLRDETRLMLIFERQNHSGTVTFTQDDMSVADRLTMVQAAADALISKRPDAVHTKRTFEP